MSPPRLSLVLLLLPPCASAVRFLVLRHGQTDHNRDGIIQGSSDVSRLSDRGRTQAREVGAALARLGDVRVARTFLSPLARAQQTHEILLLDRPDLPTPTTLDGLREIDLSSWEGRAKAELRAEQPDVYAAWQCDPLAMVVDGRKPIVELWERARSAAWLAMLDADSRPASPHISPYLEALDAVTGPVSSDSHSRGQPFRRTPLCSAVFSRTRLDSAGLQLCLAAFVALAHSRSSQSTA